MCGLNAIVATGGSPDRSLLERMADAVSHRGPDERGVAILGRAGFSHTRLSIIDPEHGQQPMYSDDGRVMLVFNGEIFNHVELRGELEAHGVRFATRSDTELLLRAFLFWGEACVDRFNGQWAFVIWDDRTQRLVASRDRFGIHPLHYAVVGGGLVVGSTIASIRLHPEVATRPDVVALDDVFTFWSPRPGRTFFEGIRQLPPGHILAFAEGRLDVRPYWTPDFTDGRDGSDDVRSEAELLDELEVLLADSVRLRLRADVPVGAYLSGGLDSALTTALIQRHSDATLRTFSVTFDDAEFDEQRYQDEVVAHLRTDHERIRCTGRDISAVFPEVVRHAEQPLLRTAPAPLFLLSRLVAENGFKVVLTGEGADELFGGYDIFKEAKIRRFWLKDIDSSMRPHLLKRLYPYMPAMQAQSPDYLRAFFQVSVDAASSPLFSHLPRWTTTAGTKLFYSDDVRAELAGRDPLGEVAADLPPASAEWSDFAVAQYLELAHLLPGYILSAQGDRMLMAHSVEGRFPFLDHRVAEFAMGLSTAFKMRALDEKYLLKKFARGLVPESIVRRPKQPYRAPDVASFFDADGCPHDDYVGDVLSERAVRDVGLFDPARVAALVSKCADGRAMSTRDNQSFVGILSTQLLAGEHAGGSA